LRRLAAITSGGGDPRRPPVLVVSPRGREREKKKKRRTKWFGTLGDEDTIKDFDVESPGRRRCVPLVTTSLAHQEAWSTAVVYRVEGGPRRAPPPSVGTCWKRGDRLTRPDRGIIYEAVGRG